MPILTVNKLNKSYGSGKNLTRAVDNVSFEVEKGEFVAIIGASGSGKSTLLHLIGGVDSKDSGEIIVGGTDLSKMNSDQLAIYRRREVGIIYQFYNLLPILTVEENIAVPARLDGRKVSANDMDEMLNLLGLKKRRHHLPNQLSGGEQQRAAIGRALINRPSLLLADEPTGNLDTKSSDEIVALLKNYNRDYQQTIILVTHNPEVAAVASRVITMADGRIISDVRN